MKKVFIHREDSIEAAAGKMAETEDADLILVIPRNSKVGSSAASLRALRDEATGQGKRIVVESVDEQALAFAEENKIENFHPLFSGPKAFSDIVSSESRAAGAKKAAKAKKEPVRTAKKGTKKINLRVVPQPEPEEEPEPEPAPAPEPRPAPEPEPLPLRAYAPLDTEEESIMEEPVPEAEPEEEEERPRYRWLVRSLVLLVLAGAGVWVASTYFARADVAINFKTVPWTYENTFLADREAAEPDAEARIVPAEVFRDSRNLTQLYPASGRAQVSQTATGQVTIYNAYSSQPQTLVATTRFETPDGKIYRLDSQVVVPGAEIRNGQIIPSSIKASVTADKAGPEYNTGPVPRLTIPGFKGSPRFNGFYGALEEGAKDGFVGERAVPTDEDVANARAKTSEILRSSLETNILSKRPREFRILDNVAKIEVTRLTVNRNTDENGNFSVFGEAELQAIGFREDDLRALLLGLAREEHPDSVFHELKLDYRNVRASYGEGELRFSLSAEGKLIPEFADEEFKNSLAGEGVNEARSMIMKLPGLADAKVSLWPFWLRTLPEEASRIRLELNYL